MTFLALTQYDGISLFSQTPCLVASFHLPKPFDALSLPHYEIALKEDFQKLGFTLDVRIPKKNAFHDYLMTTAIVVDAFAKLFDLKLQTRFANSENGDIQHLIISADNAFLANEIVSLSLLYIASLAEDELALAGLRVLKREEVIARLKATLTKKRQLTKSDMTQDYQKFLKTSSLPWFALDRDEANIGCLQIGFGRHQQVLCGSVTNQSSEKDIALSKSKIQTQHFLKRLGFPVATYAVISAEDQLKTQAEKIGYPVVIKADYGTQGDRVFPNLKNYDELLHIYRLLTAGLQKVGLNYDILLEKHLQGDSHRVEVAKQKIQNVYQMFPAGVIGDGIHSIRQLIELENKKRQAFNERHGHKSFAFLGTGDVEQLCLKKQGLDLDALPAKKLRVDLSATSNWSVGGTFEGITEKVHPENNALLLRLAKHFEIDILGIDVIAEDLSKPFYEQAFNVIEVNHSPGIFNCIDRNGTLFNSSEKLLHTLAPDVFLGQVPVVVVKACDESESILSVAEAFFVEQAYSPGKISANGIFINGSYFASPAQIDEKNPSLQLLTNKEVGAAMFSRTSGQLAKFGLGVGGCDIAIFSDFDPGLLSLKFVAGLPAQQADLLLANNVRLSSIVILKDAKMFEFAMRVQAEKLFLISLEPWSEEHQSFFEKGAQGIAVMEQQAKRVLLDVRFRNESEQQWHEIKEKKLADCLLNLALLHIMKFG